MAGGFSAPEQSSGGGKKHHRKQGVLSEPPAMMLADIAFVLLLFFVALASNDPTQGRKQDVPRGENKPGTTGPTQNLEVSLTRTTVSINNLPVVQDDFPSRIQAQLAGKTKTEDRIVVVRSTKDSPYWMWVRVTSQIEQAGGVITLQLEEEREMQVK